MDHDSSVVLPLLSPSSISTSSSGSRFPSAGNDGLGRLGKLRVPFPHVNSWGFWFVQICIVCRHQVSWPTSSRTWNTAQEDSFQRCLSKLMYSWLVFRGNWDRLNQCSKRNWHSVNFLAISPLECRLVMGHRVVHVAQSSKSIPSHSPTVLLVVRFARVR